ncbi:ribonuclease R [Dialister pneumosintes]|uniref:Ribonuclease R n=1 Tax=Dialister pneumosintes TaxID=39950 RepID=A0A1B3WDM8_9FIRM|nr:ribonuclease R [Dialister pneumosintes]AOH39076.1 ribonuclease R [Dialister pneumosintes]
MLEKLLTYKPGTILQGTYKAYGNRFGFVLTDEKYEDIYIAEKDAGSAVNNDIVEVEIMKSKTGRHSTEGRIIHVITRANTTVVGTYEMTRYGGEVIPVDEKINMLIEIPSGQECQAVTGARVVVEVTKWPGRYTNAEGKIIEIIGYKGDKGLDIDIIVAQHKIPHVFNTDVMKEAAALCQDIFLEKNMADFRVQELVTIDGSDSKDLDDAIYCELKDNGHYRLGVHIADVSRYVKPRSALDKEAYQRGNSVYLADRVIPMLPFELSNDLCSLNEGKERYAISCIMDVDPNGIVTLEKITPSIIKVARRCTYPEINQAFDEGIVSDGLQKFLPMLTVFKECTHLLRKQREGRGALAFDFPEYKVALDEKGAPLRIIKRERGEAERMIEDAMIAANETVASFITRENFTAVYRVHDQPNQEKLDILRQMINVLGINIKIPADVKPKDMQQLLEFVKGKDIAAVIEVMALRSLPQACYSTENVGHFGIASSCYTHFTSPIRRYSDLLVHRLIKQLLYKKLRKSEQEKQMEFLKKAVDHISMTEQNATDAERETTELKMTEYMEPFVGEPFDAHITGVTKFGVFVGLENGVEGLVHISTMDDDEYVYNEESMQLTGRFNGVQYSLGMPVRVTLIKADKDKHEIDFIMGEIHSPLQLEKSNRKKKKPHSKKVKRRYIRIRR